MPQELDAITKTYDLILWSVGHTAKFPKSHRFVLGERIERNLYDVLDLLIRAKYTREKAWILAEVNLRLETLRFQMRMAKDLKVLALRSYEFAARSVNEVGQLVGGWIKAARRAR